MAMETVQAKMQLKDKDDNIILDEEGKPAWTSCSVDYDFGDNLDQAIELCGPEAVHSNYKANARVGLQAIIRGKLKAGHTPETIQASVKEWRPGMVMDKVAVDPAVAIKAVFASYSPEKQAEFLKSLGVAI